MLGVLKYFVLIVVIVVFFPSPPFFFLDKTNPELIGTRFYYTRRTSVETKEKIMLKFEIFKFGRFGNI